MPADMSGTCEHRIDHDVHYEFTSLASFVHTKEGDDGMGNVPEEHASGVGGLASTLCTTVVRACKRHHLLYGCLRQTLA